MHELQTNYACMSIGLRGRAIATLLLSSDDIVFSVLDKIRPVHNPNGSPKNRLFLHPVCPALQVHCNNINALQSIQKNVVNRSMYSRRPNNHKPFHHHLTCSLCRDDNSWSPAQHEQSSFSLHLLLQWYVLVLLLAHSKVGGSTTLRFLCIHDYYMDIAP